MNCLTPVEKLVKRMRRDAVAYRSGATLGRAYVDSEDVLDAAANAIETLLSELETARSERDAAVEDLSGQCEYCAKNDDCISRKGEHWNCWQWRGIKGKETSNDKV